MKKILIVSDEDSCRSRMAKEILIDFGRGMEIVTAGVMAGGAVPTVVDELMDGQGLQLSHQPARDLSAVADETFDYVITLTPAAAEAIADLPAPVKGAAHFDIPDPAAHRHDAQLEARVMATYEQLYRELYRLYRNVLSDLLMPACTCGANTFCRCE